MLAAEAAADPAREGNSGRIPKGRRIQVRFGDLFLLYPSDLASVFRYLRALATLYIRMTFGAVEVYELLEPLLKDYRKLRLRSMGASCCPSLTFASDIRETVN